MSLLPSSPDSEQTFRIMRGWVEDCLSHDTCQKALSKHGRRLPTRLIHVAGAPSPTDVTIQARLCQGKDLPIDTPYTTLSHCWGKGKFLTLTKGNFDQMLRNVPVNQLSQVFQDAMRVTLGLGISYIWIDSLCIIQDSDNLQDWIQEAPRMGSIYSQATCGIAATGFENGKVGIFSRPAVDGCAKSLPPPGSVPCSVPCIKIDWELGKVFPNLSTPKYTFFAVMVSPWVEKLLVGNTEVSVPRKSVDISPLYKRAWTAQERILSPRLIHFCADRIIWECEKLVVNEAFPAGLVLYGPEGVMNNHNIHGVRKNSIRTLDSPTGDETYNCWYDFVSPFSQSHITIADDRVAAVAGIADILGNITGDRYMFGCWLGDMRRGLLWSRMERYNYDGPILSIPDKPRAPSWSWLSVDGGVSYGFHYRSTETMGFKEIKISVMGSAKFTDLPASTEDTLVVEGPLYRIEHKVWTGAILDADERASYYGGRIEWTYDSDLIACVDARDSEKPTDSQVDSRHLLRWTDPTHLLPLARSENRVHGILLIKDPTKEHIFIRGGFFNRAFESENERVATFPDDGPDPNPSVLVDAGLHYSGIKRFILE
jgi:hypothetical protein